jgi:hypothetical protein
MMIGTQEETGLRPQPGNGLLQELVLAIAGLRAHPTGGWVQTFAQPERGTRRKTAHPAQEPALGSAAFDHPLLLLMLETDPAASGSAAFDRHWPGTDPPPVTAAAPASGSAAFEAGGTPPLEKRLVESDPREMGTGGWCMLGEGGEAHWRRFGSPQLPGGGHGMDRGLRRCCWGGRGRGGVDSCCCCCCCWRGAEGVEGMGGERIRNRP